MAYGATFLVVMFLASDLGVLWPVGAIGCVGESLSRFVEFSCVCSFCVVCVWCGVHVVECGCMLWRLVHCAFRCVTQKYD